MTEDNLWMLKTGCNKYHERESNWPLAGSLNNSSCSPDGLMAEDLLLDGAKTMDEVNLSANVLLADILRLW